MQPSHQRGGKMISLSFTSAMTNIGKWKGKSICILGSVCELSHKVFSENYVCYFLGKTVEIMRLLSSYAFKGQRIIVFTPPRNCSLWKTIMFKNLNLYKRRKTVGETFDSWKNHLRASGHYPIYYFLTFQTIL